MLLLFLLPKSWLLLTALSCNLLCVMGLFLSYAWYVVAQTVALPMPSFFVWPTLLSSSAPRLLIIAFLSWLLLVPLFSFVLLPWS